MDSLRAVLTRMVGLAVLPASLPGNAPGTIDDFCCAPLETIRGWRFALVWALTRQILGCRKLEVPDDTQLARLAASRARYVQRGWEEVKIQTADGLLLDAMTIEPGLARARSGSRYARGASRRGGAPRWVLWIGGNFQKYEDWLSYFDLYSRDADVGFAAFNFRGVGESEGAVLCCDDLLADVAACVRHLTERHGVTADRLLLHGFSLGGSISALYLASPAAPRCALVSDRSFRSLPHAAHALIRGPHRDPPPRSPRPAASRPADSSGGGTALLASLAASLLPWLLHWLRVLGGTIAVAALRGLGWELHAEAALEQVAGRKLLLYHREDNVVRYAEAGLHASLARQGALERDASFRAMEITSYGAEGWAVHDFPLCTHERTWTNLMQGVAWAFGDQ